jgi:hypothetical protein
MIEFCQKLVSILPKKNKKCQNFVKNQSESCQTSVRIFCQNFVTSFFGKIGTKAQLTFLATMSKKSQPNTEITEKRDKKYYRVFCIPRPDATKSHLVISGVTSPRTQAQRLNLFCDFYWGPHRSGSCPRPRPWTKGTPQKRRRTRGGIN